MKTIPEILDHVKEKKGIKNDYNLALQLGLTPNAIFKIRNNQSIPSDDTCIKLANLAGENAEKIILIAHATRAESKEATKIWNGILKKAIGFSIIIVLLSPTLTITTPARQSIHYATNNNYSEILMEEGFVDCLVSCRYLAKDFLLRRKSFNL